MLRVTVVVHAAIFVAVAMVSVVVSVAILGVAVVVSVMSVRMRRPPLLACIATALVAKGIIA